MNTEVQTRSYVATDSEAMSVEEPLGTSFRKKASAREMTSEEGESGMESGLGERPSMKDRSKNDDATGSCGGYQLRGRTDDEGERGRKGNPTLSTVVSVTTEGPEARQCRQCSSVVLPGQLFLRSMWDLDL